MYLGRKFLQCQDIFREVVFLCVYLQMHLNSRFISLYEFHQENFDNEETGLGVFRGGKVSLLFSGSTSRSTRV